MLELWTSKSDRDARLARRALTLGLLHFEGVKCSIGLHLTNRAEASLAFFMLACLGFDTIDSGDAFD